MVRSARSLRELLVIRAHNKTLIEKVNGNHGTALGFKYTVNKLTQEPAVIIFVAEKKDETALDSAEIAPKKLSTRIDGELVECRTDVESGKKKPIKIPPLSEENQSLTAKLGSGSVGVVGGVKLVKGQKALWVPYSGTAACAVVDAKECNCVLTNDHVARGAIRCRKEARVFPVLRIGDRHHRNRWSASPGVRSQTSSTSYSMSMASIPASSSSPSVRVDAPRNKTHTTRSTFGLFSSSQRSLVICLRMLLLAQT